MQSEHLGAGSLLRQRDINSLFKPREPSTQQDLKAEGGMVSTEGSGALQEPASLRALQTQRSRQRNRVQLHACCQLQADHGWRQTSALGSSREDSPPSNGRVQHPWDVCGT